MTYLTLHRPARNPFKFYNPFFAPLRAKTDADTYNWAPSVDISETDDTFEVRAELPGVAKDDLHVSVKENLLTLSGEKRQEHADDTQNYRRVERRYGSFQRRFTLPSEVAADAIKAEYSDGVLTLSIPKPEAAKPTEVPITTAA
ncbi:Hsp20/alpha crystallin family protein [Candidatus Poribacteria bacterium]|nr:Hsp20/alpha crystallin family protein [Candidatus Poribacteria bacterium]MYK95927.1 Hsp20/alpha crystallin family protein [Candidatus Poribacteria bacterium]